MSAQPRFLNFRLDEALRPRVENFEEKTGVSAVSIAKQLLPAAMDYFEEHGELPVPMAVVPKSQLLSNQVGESPLKYGATTLLGAIKEQTKIMKDLLARSAEQPKLHVLPPPASTGAESPRASTRKRKAGR